MITDQFQRRTAAARGSRLFPGTRNYSYPHFLTVEMTGSVLAGVATRYRARTVAVWTGPRPGVVQISQASGQAVQQRSSLSCRLHTLGNVAALQLDQNVTKLGFPGMSGGTRSPLPAGWVDTFVPDQLGTSRGAKGSKRENT